MTTNIRDRSTGEGVSYTIEQFEQSLDFSWMPSMANLKSVAGAFDIVAGSWYDCGVTCQANSWGTQCNCR